MTVQDSLLVDGLFEVYNKFAMGNCGEHVAETKNISREEQDDHCLESYSRAEKAWAEGLFVDEIAPVTVKLKAGETIVKDDED